MTMMTRPIVVAFTLSITAIGCAVGPDYKRPDVAMPDSFKYATATTEAPAEWRPMNSHAPTAQTEWWQIFKDDDLNTLIAAAGTANQTLQQAEARYRQASALLRATRSTFWPTIGVSGAGTRSGGNTQSTETSYTAAADASWSVDLWGRIRREIEADRALAKVSAADLAGTHLSIQAAVAESYIRLRILDQHQDLLQQTIEAYDKALTLTQNQYTAGIVARADVIQAETQVQSLRTQIADLERARAEEENIIAVLLGRPPAGFAVTETGLLPSLPTAPETLPSTLLVRRPDIVAAEQHVVAANAEIGVARAAWFPDLTLGARGQLQSSRFSDLFDTPQRIWSLGPSFALTLFDAGRRSAVSDQAEARYDEQVAAYRQTVLDGLRDVEDSLLALQTLQNKKVQQQRLVALAEENERVVMNRYKSGMVTYLEISVAQNLTFSSRRTALDIDADLLLAHIQLITALGGGWQGIEQDQRS